MVSVLKVETNVDALPPVVEPIRCPQCRHNGAFFGYKGVHDLVWFQSEDPIGNPGGELVPFRAGIRGCPNKECESIVFIVCKCEELVVTYPAEVLDFNASDIPPNVKDALAEAITCHSQGCYTASALMVRKSLEELCHDRNAKGDNLAKRLDALSASVVVPNEFIEAAHDIRFLGNDAAHVTAREFDEVGKEEVEIAIELMKELLKAVYQLKSLADRLRGLKRGGSENQ